jgi:hypothetical protein
MRARVTLSGLSCGLTVVALGAAQPDPISIWYRNTEGCPSGTDFVARLRELGRDAELAKAGDAIDFVVTLGEDGAESMGQLERQTSRGTIAIRHVRAAECSAVADALALSLDLALAPGQETPAPEAQAPSEPPPDSRDRAAAATLPSGALSQPTAPPTRTPPPPSDASAAPRSRLVPSTTQVRVGAQAELVTVLLPSPLLGAGLFLDYELSPEALGLRVTAHGATASSTRGGYELDYRLLAGRLDACPLAWTVAGWQLRPCVAAEGGAVLVDYSSPRGLRDAGPWFSAGGLVRARWSASSKLALEGTVGVSAPLIRYRVKDASEQELVRVQAVGLMAAVGIAFGPW